MQQNGMSKHSDPIHDRKPMLIRSSFLSVVVVALTLSGSLLADRLGGIKNYREYSADFSSAGQPSRERFELLKSEGFERVVYIACVNSEGEISDEDQLVRALGMHYAQVRVIWDAPTKADFDTFAAVMQSAPEKKTLLHLSNFRRVKRPLDCVRILARVLETVDVRV